jgi:hypothetical protein
MSNIDDEVAKHFGDEGVRRLHWRAAETALYTSENRPKS